MLISKIFIMFGTFMLLSAIGTGPAVMMTSNRYNRRVLVSLALSPAIGLTLVAFPLYSLFLLGLPVGKSAIPITFLALLLSITLILLDWRSHRCDYANLLNTVSHLKLLTICA